MAHVVEYDEFNAFREEFKRERQENQLLRQVVGALVWLTRAQAADVLNVSDSTMHRLIQRNKIPYRAEGNRQLFSINDLITYLKAQKIGEQDDQDPITSSVIKQKTDSARAKSV